MKCLCFVFLVYLHIIRVVQSNTDFLQIETFDAEEFNGTLQPGKVHIIYKLLKEEDKHDISHISLYIPHAEQYRNYGNDSIIEMTVSNHVDVIIISLPVIYSDGQLGWHDSKILNPTIMKSSEAVEKRHNGDKLVITLQSRLDVDIEYQIRRNVIDQSDYYLRFPPSATKFSISDKELSSVNPVVFYINSVEQNIKNLKLTVSSDDDVCAILLTAPHNISIYERSEELDNYERRLTFTKRADIYFSENELEKFSDFRIFVFINPNDDQCGNKIGEHKRQDERKFLNFNFEKIDNYDYILPVSILILVISLSAAIIGFWSSRKPENDFNLILIDDSPGIEDVPLLGENYTTENDISIQATFINYPLAVIIPIFMHMSAEYHKFTTTSMANLDEICFHNHACAKPLWSFRAFNNIISNVGYLIFGFFFILVSLKKKHWISGKINCGVYESNLLDITIGLFLMMEAVGSAAYHVCPSDVTIQFDTPCIQVICGLLIIRQWSIRHQTPSPSYSNSLFVAIFFTNYINSAFSKWILTRVLIAAAHFLTVFACVRAKNTFFDSQLQTDQYAKTIFIGLFGTLNFFLIIIYGFFTQLVHLNQINTFTLIINCAAYLMYYTLMKLSKQEKISREAKMHGILAVVFWSLAIVHYFQEDIDWSVSPAESRALNKPCILFNFFGSHDLWHVFSAFATLFTFLYVTVIDLDLKDFSRNSINRF